MLLLLTMAAITLQPVAEAVLHISEKTPVGSVLRSAGWAELPQQLRNTAQLSAGVENARVLNHVQTGLLDILSHNRNEAGVIADRSKFLAELGALAAREGLAPSNPALKGGLQDITSLRRGELIYEMQTGQAYGFANWKAGQDPDALEASPAQELVRVEDRKVPRDWERRWAEVGGRPGRMAALKTDPIWEKLSRFGNPWPPFDYNSGMGVEDLSRTEAEELGLLSPGERVSPTDAAFDQNLQASVKDISPELRQSLRSLFGDQVDVDSETIKWKGNVADYERSQQDLRIRARGVFARSAEALSGVRPGDVGSEGVGRVEAQVREFSPRWASEISGVTAGRKPLFHEDLSLLNPQQLQAAAEQIQRTVPPGVVVHVQDGHLYVYHPDLVGRLAVQDQPLLPQVIANRDNGLWLGYGANVTDRSTVRVNILDPNGKPVSGFRAPQKYAHLYASARTQDFADAMGDGFSYRIIWRAP